jgi:predicted transcriptional regulator
MTNGQEVLELKRKRRDRLYIIAEILVIAKMGVSRLKLCIEET